MSDTKIEWADVCWNPITGCSKVSPGCQNCYAERFARRLAGRCGYPVDNPFRVTLHPDRLDRPSHWRKPRRIFVNSMGDLFHDAVPGDWIETSYNIMSAHCQHNYLILTKRPDNMRRWLHDMDPSGLTAKLPIWLGVTAENQEMAEQRIPVLLETPAALRFISVEPMLGPVELKPGPMWTIDWVIAGPETGGGKRHCDPAWIQDLADQCAQIGIPFFDKRKNPLRREVPA